MSDGNSFKYVKIMLPLLHAIVKFCSTNRLFTNLKCLLRKSYERFDTGIVRKLQKFQYLARKNFKYTYNGKITFYPCDWWDFFWASNIQCSGIHYANTGPYFTCFRICRATDGSGGSAPKCFFLLGGGLSSLVISNNH